jgi:ribosomal protein S12 methylthiotransferase accessory factor
MKSRFQVHKDLAPQVTIRKIKKLLASIGIKPVEKNLRFSEDCYSTRLEHPLISVGTNGKGVSRLLSRAGAYAEFMERIQTLALFGTCFGCMPDHDLYPDSMQLATRICLERMRPILDEMCSDAVSVTPMLARVLGKTVLVLPYYCLSDRTVTYLPKRLLDETVATNGMCAGNTPEEAIVQGLCEVLERYSLRTILIEEEAVPTIPDGELRHLRSYKILKQMTRLGFSVIVKDCTLGGKVPVIGIICLNPDRTKYRVCFGSDPLLDVALQRCLTEVTQNYDRRTIELVMKDLRAVLAPEASHEVQKHMHLQYIKAFLSGGGSFGQGFFFCKGRPKYREAFMDSSASHGEMLDWLVTKVHGLSRRIYVRNVSFLGFPTFHVYIPGMSEVRKIDEGEIDDYFVKKTEVRQYLLRLPRLSPKDVRKCIGLMEALAPRHFFADYSFYSGLFLREEADMFEMNIDWLITFLCLRIGDYRGAYRHLDKFLKSDEVEGFDEYLMTALFYLHKRAEGADDKIAMEKLSNLFGRRSAMEVSRDLRNPRRALHYLTLPVCGRCKSCPARRDCLYPQWKSIVSAMQRQFAKNPIDQVKSLAHVWSGGPDSTGKGETDPSGISQ